MTNPVTVEVTRGARVESWHRGAVIAVDGDGKIIFSVGDVDAPTFPRSACKAMQALPLVESGAADAYGFGRQGTGARLLVAQWRRRTRGARRLDAGARRPRCRDARMRRSLVVEPEGADPSGPHHGQADGAAQQLLRQAFRLRLHLRPPGHRSEGLCWLRPSAAARNPRHDGKPDRRRARRATIAAPMAARSRPMRCRSRASPTALPGWRPAPVSSPCVHKAARRLFDACMAEPFYVAGTGRACTALMQIAPGQIFAKTGAEGVFCAAIPEQGVSHRRQV
jgi:hypothetical protein